MELFGKRLKELRTKKRMTLKEVGALLGVSLHAISKYESPTANSTPSPENISKLAGYFEVSTDYLLGRTDNPIPTDRKEITLEKPDDISQEAIEMARSISEISQEQQDLLIPYIQAMINEAKKKI